MRYGPEVAFSDSRVLEGFLRTSVSPAKTPRHPRPSKPHLGSLRRSFHNMPGWGNYMPDMQCISPAKNMLNNSHGKDLVAQQHTA